MSQTVTEHTFDVENPDDSCWSSFSKSGYVFLSGPLAENIVGIPTLIEDGVAGEKRVSVKFFKPMETVLLEKLEPCISGKLVNGRSYVQSIILSWPKLEPKEPI